MFFITLPSIDHDSSFFFVALTGRERGEVQNPLSREASRSWLASCAAWVPQSPRSRSDPPSELWGVTTLISSMITSFSSLPASTRSPSNWNVSDVLPLMSRLHVNTNAVYSSTRLVLCLSPAFRSFILIKYQMCCSNAENFVHCSPLRQNTHTKRNLVAKCLESALQNVVTKTRVQQTAIIV